MRPFAPTALIALSIPMTLIAGLSTASGQLKAGVAVIDITPVNLPVIVNGGFIERKTDQVTDPLKVRCLALSNGQETVVIAVVDSCMIPRDVCDKVKALAARETGISPSRMLIAATHTHSAPSLMNYCLGSRGDDPYTNFFVPRVADCISRAAANLRLAEVGWAVAKAPRHTYCRRWIRHPERVGVDPFGETTVRAMMHPGYQNSEYLGPAGPVDTDLSLLSLRTLEGDPICLLANFSMHYVGGVSGLSADYWGHFSRIMQQKVLRGPTRQANSSRFVAMMSQGTSGDLHWMDYSRPAQRTTPERFAEELAEIATSACEQIVYKRDVSIAMAESKMTLGRRLPDSSRLDWAKKLNTARGTRRPANQPEVYAEQAEWIHKNPSEEIILQALRIGEVGITAMPNEVFGVTGLKIKAQSPLHRTFNMELANGAAGYIPPREQHELGGYTTWPARTAGLEVDAEAKIVDRVLELLEQVSGTKRRPLTTDLYPESIRANMTRALQRQ